MVNNCKVISIANQKGGVGKTVSCVNLGIGLAKKGNKVLLLTVGFVRNQSEVFVR